MDPFWIAVAVAAFAFGLVGGCVLHYYVEHKPLLEDYRNLIQTVVKMKKQGFVPQFDIEQVKEVDLTKGIDES